MFDVQAFLGLRHGDAFAHVPKALRLRQVAGYDGVAGAAGLDGLTQQQFDLLMGVRVRFRVAQLQQHGNERSQLLHAAGLSADREGLAALAARSAIGAELLARSEELSALLQRCQDANLRNGRLIRANKATVSKMLGILHGGETPGLYDSRGGTARISQQRPLSQA